MIIDATQTKIERKVADNLQRDVSLRLDFGNCTVRMFTNSGGVLFSYIGRNDIIARPHLYLEHDNLVWRKLAKECLASDSEED